VIGVTWRNIFDFPVYFHSPFDSEMTKEAVEGEEGADSA